MKKLAVLLPTYNTAPYLAESIDSILNQTFKDFDLYIYDDCSTDNTSEIVFSYKDCRIFYKKNKRNLGISKTLNLGLEELTHKYEYIARMDADDWSYSERFQKQIDFMDKNPKVAMCGTQAYWLEDMNEVKSVNWLQPENYNFIKLYLLFGASFGHQTVVLRSEVIVLNRYRYDTNIRTCEDWDLWSRIVKNYEIVNLPDILSKNRIVKTSNHRSLENKMKHLNERSVIISKYWKTFNIDFTPEQVFEFYYKEDLTDKDKFRLQLKIFIHAFNGIFINHTTFLSQVEKKNFSYLLSRRILDYWKRSNLNRLNIHIWFILFTNVKFIGLKRLIKSQLF